MLVNLVSGHACSTLSGQPSEHCGLAARPGAQVEPAGVLSPVNGGLRRNHRGELGPLILGTRTPIADRRKSGGVTRLEQDSARGDRAECDASIQDVLSLVCQFVDAHESRAGHQGDRGNLVVGGEKILEFVGRVAVRLQSLAKGTDHPRGVRVTHTQGLVFIFDSGQCGLALGVLLAGNRAQDGVDEANRTIGQVLARDVDRRRHGRVVGHAHIEELVCAHTSQDQNTRIQVSQRTIHVAGDHPVEATDGAQRAVHELGGKGGIPITEVPLSACLTQRLGQDDVREGTLGGHLVKHLVGDATGLVGPPQLAVPVGIATLTHRASSSSPPRRIPASGRAPLAHAAASIHDLPAGATCPRTNAPRAQPTVTCFLVTSSWPGSRSSRSTGVATPSFMRARPGSTV